MSTFKRDIKVDTTTLACGDCGRKMVTRRRYAEIVVEAAPAPRSNGTFIKDQNRIVRHGAHGLCTGCVAKGRVRTSRPREPLARVVEADYRREEWAFLKEAGVSAHEAARRLGVSVQTLEDYDS